MSNNLNQGASIEAERAAFEAWHHDKFPDVEFKLLLGAYAVTSATPRPHGSFAVNERWKAWAERARRTPADAVGAGELNVAQLLQIVAANTGKRISLSLGDLDCYIAVARAAIAADRAQRKQAGQQEMIDIGQAPGGQKGGAA
jgi:hypothetical protein